MIFFFYHVLICKTFHLPAALENDHSLDENKEFCYGSNCYFLRVTGPLLSWS